MTITSTRIWNDGPPPHVGWWNASSSLHPADNIWRHWNGQAWSRPVADHKSATYAAVVLADGHMFTTLAIRWTDYYPEGAQVPRINPNEVQHG